MNIETHVTPSKGDFRLVSLPFFYLLFSILSITVLFPLTNRALLAVSLHSASFHSRLYYTAR
jgi:hypothetical protein